MEFGMTPIANSVPNGRNGEKPKSWKKINEERKALRKQKRQEQQIKMLEKQKEEEELAKLGADAAKKIKEDPSTVSIAVPGSILENAQSAELRTYVAGQIARAACIFRVSEVVVFDDIGLATAKQMKRVDNEEGGDESGVTKTVRGSCLQLARILQYLECPQYLRKFFFPLHKDLKYSGLLNPLDTPHHLRQQSSFIYREGIISDKKAKEGFSYVNVGLLNDVLVNKAIEPGVRVTVKLQNATESNKKLRGTIVSPDEPRRETGVYWGYQVRIAHTISEIFTKSPYEDGYDLTIGTSDRGSNIHAVEQKSLHFKHMLLVFGGLKGLEGALANDEQLNVDDPALLFDHYVNVLPRQGSRTIRTEEAVLIALSALQDKLNPVHPDIEEDLSQYLPQSEDTGGSLIPQQQFTKKKNKQKPRNAEVPVDQPVAHEEKSEGNLKRPLPDEVEDVSPPKFQRNRNNPFTFGKDPENKKSFGKANKNPFNKSKDFTDASPLKLQQLNAKSPKNKKNPFQDQVKPRVSSVTNLTKSDSGNSHDNHDNSVNSNGSVDDDFEVVPVSVPGQQQQSSLAVVADDLSRFD